MKQYLNIAIFLLILISCGVTQAAFIADKSFQPQKRQPTYQQDPPVVLFDEAHHNYSKLSGRYQPFAKVLASDGYELKTNTKPFTQATLADADILVIVNALNERNAKNWDLPTWPAFTRQEIEAVYRWVKSGGSLMLVADHLPFAGASADLGAIFGFHFNNGYVEDMSNRDQIFSVTNGSLQQHPILAGRTPEFAVTQVRGFVGQGFLSPPAAKPLMVFSDKAESYMPHQSWKFPAGTPTLSMAGWHQAASLRFHRGRIVVVGEAGMFTAQIDTDDDFSMGLQEKGAEQNEQFLLNILYWLSQGKATATNSTEKDMSHSH